MPLPPNLFVNGFTRHFDGSSKLHVNKSDIDLGLFSSKMKKPVAHHMLVTSRVIFLPPLNELLSKTSSEITKKQNPLLFLLIQSGTPSLTLR